MIKNTFCTLDGVGEKSEKRLWRDGVLTWKDFTDSRQIAGISPDRKLLYDAMLMRDEEELQAGNASYFNCRIKRRDHWRLFDFFREDVVCLDIETNGFQPHYGGVVTVVGLYDGYDYKTLIRGENLSAESLTRELSRYKCLITFFGASFDVPFILKSFSGVRFEIPHFDLCFAAKRLGLEGGLKRLEQSLGIMREDAVVGLDGYDAVKLWEAYRRGSREALDLLITYNREDTVNLMHIASVFYDRLRQSTGIEEYLSSGVA
ncbi:MAG: ribonuclease H-like domain-containing protein [Nitrospirae bacterium]|nr:ribonuclease H-like domain-containing protein [Nitrospirota bacterium]